MENKLLRRCYETSHLRKQGRVTKPATCRNREVLQTIERTCKNGKLTVLKIGNKLVITEIVLPFFMNKSLKE